MVLIFICTHTYTCTSHLLILTHKHIHTQVYYERSGQTDLAKARKAGLPWLVWHYIYATEFVFKVLQPREEAKTITIFDVTGVGLNTIAGEPFEFIRQVCVCVCLGII